MRLEEEEKKALLEAARLPSTDFASPTPPLSSSPEMYFRQLEAWAKLIPPPKKPVAFEGQSWRL